ncbi:MULTISPECIES: hemolysin family protein [Caballeronia]|uniref:HlyC/CorC family transporter n=3 Tax=Caballeronia TaxID=1827195 RepID=A0AA37IDX2_9BURK|nr:MULTISPECIES: hemolysin family protein [Caballeronia]GJH14554.1 HlyC/CorC family transporter [Caballeronia novacaledonica]GJH20098.1 HlyC/CorC family transporter [Caballeronia novacaledonica]GJH28045.1 HlyC/CorC family transporter [Caballeronia novacaledonica]
MAQVVALIGALLLVALNGFFVAAEFGLVKLRPTRVKALARTNGLPGRLLAKVHGQLDAYLSACQLGITLASLGLGWIGEPAFATLLHPLFSLLGVESEKLIETVSLFFAFTVISFLHIVVGELAPKSWAIRRAEQVGLWLATPLYGFYWVMYPFIWVLNTSANFVLRLFGISAEHGHDAHYSTDELKLILRGRRHGGASSYNEDEWNTIAHSLDFSRMTVSDLMRPAHELVGLRNDLPMRDNLAVISRHRFSRYPLFADASGERVIGMIHLKDLLLAGDGAPRGFHFTFSKDAAEKIDKLSRHVRPVQYVAPNLSALELFRRFRKGAPHLAIVGRKGAKPIGFITLDNLLGALVGQIHDEFRQGDADWSRMDDGTLMGKGSLPVVSLERALGIDIDEGRAESVGGLVINALGDLPSEGQRVEFDRFDIVVKKMKGPRIVLVRVYPREEALEEAD